MLDEVTMAREGLLDALEALQRHLDALVVIGAQADAARQKCLAAAGMAVKKVG